MSLPVINAKYWYISWKRVDNFQPCIFNNDFYNSHMIHMHTIILHVKQWFYISTRYTIWSRADVQWRKHYGDIIMGAIASQLASLTIVYSTDYSNADQRKHQSSASLAFVQEIHRGPVNSPHKWPVTWKMFPFDDVIISACIVKDIYYEKHCMTDVIFCKRRTSKYVGNAEYNSQHETSVFRDRKPATGHTNNNPLNFYIYFYI